MGIHIHKYPDFYGEKKKERNLRFQLSGHVFLAFWPQVGIPVLALVPWCQDGLGFA